MIEGSKGKIFIIKAGCNSFTILVINNYEKTKKNKKDTYVYKKWI